MRGTEHDRCLIVSSSTLMLSLIDEAIKSRLHTARQRLFTFVARGRTSGPLGESSDYLLDVMINVLNETRSYRTY